MTNLDDWIKQMKEEAEKEVLAKEVAKKVREDPEYKARLELLNTQLEMLKKKRKELDKEKAELDVEIANKYLKEMGSKYRMKVSNGDSLDDVIKSTFGVNFQDLFGKL